MDISYSSKYKDILLRIIDDGACFADIDALAKALYAVSQDITSLQSDISWSLKKLREEKDRLSSSIKETESAQRNAENALSTIPKTETLYSDPNAYARNELPKTKSINSEAIANCKTEIENCKQLIEEYRKRSCRVLDLIRDIEEEDSRIRQIAAHISSAVPYVYDECRLAKRDCETYKKQIKSAASAMHDYSNTEIKESMRAEIVSYIKQKGD